MSENEKVVKHPSPLDAPPLKRIPRRKAWQRQKRKREVTDTKEYTQKNRGKAIKIFIIFPS